VLINLFDKIVAIVLLLVFSPVFLILALIIYCKDGRPIFFKQWRPGLDEKAFLLYKFRTMDYRCDTADHLLPAHQRLTSLGAWLRRWSLDELPQFFNVLKGDLSLVGPRPLLMEYLPLYNDWQRRRHEVKPGMTGWAQIHGRNTISWQQRFTLDIWYVEHRSFRLNLYILVKTLFYCLKRKGINRGPKLTMPKFTGHVGE